MVTRLRGDFGIGSIPDKNGFQLGGRNLGGRGFEMNDIRGRNRVIGSAEYRHVLASAKRTDLWGVLTLTQLEGAFFADAIYLDLVDGMKPAYLSHPEDCSSNFFADVGYGIRFLFDIANVSPSALTLDVGVPLSRCGITANASPVAVYISFVQSFSQF